MQAPSSFALKPLEGHRPSTPHPHAGSTPHQPCTPAWLSVVPSRGVLAPGDSMPLRLTASVAAGELRDAFVAEDLASAACTLDAILTLHIDGGMDHFLVVNGTFRPSFFGLSMTTLAGAPFLRASSTDSVLHPGVRTCKCVCAASVHADASLRVLLTEWLAAAAQPPVGHDSAKHALEVASTSITTLM